MNTAPILNVDRVSKAFGAVKALDEISLRVQPGQIASVIGPNGAGKTTLFNAISGFAPADSGRVELDGNDITRTPPHLTARLGLVRTFQSARPLHDSNVLENVLAGTYLHGRGGVLASLLPMPSARRSERSRVRLAAESLERVGLLDERGRYPDELSAGQLRLLEIARALVTGAKVLLLDEPAAGLNKAETARLEGNLHQIRESGITVLLVEHDVDLVLRVSDHVTVLDFGRLLRRGTPAEIRNDPAVAAAYFGIGDSSTVAEPEHGGVS